MKDNLSPEEKLLKLIKGEKKQKLAEKKIIPQTPEIQTPEKSAASVTTQARGKPVKPLDIHKLTIVLVIVSMIFLISAFVYPMFGLGKIKLPTVSQEEQSITTLEVKPEVRPLESYIEAIKSKQIFAVSTATDTSSSPTSVSNTLDLIKDIVLVGIISSEPPQAVIEDKKTQKTYYLNNGQSIGDLKVKDIQEGKVILDYLGTKYELYM